MKIVRLSTLLALLLVAMPALAQTNISWTANDDEMLGTRRATVMLASPEALFAIRIDAPDNLWFVFTYKATWVTDTKGRLFFRYDDEPAEYVEVADVSGDDYWQMDPDAFLGYPPGAQQAFMSMLIEEFRTVGVMKLQMRTDTRAYPITEFDMSGFIRVLEEAVEYVLEGAEGLQQS
jgi:hypothetical protein